MWASGKHSLQVIPCADHELLLGLGWGGGEVGRGRYDMGMEWNGTEVMYPCCVVACIHSLMQKNAAVLYIPSETHVFLFGLPTWLYDMIR